MANTGHAYDWWSSDVTNTNTGWASSGNTNNDISQRWHRRLRGPQYSVRQATLIVQETSAHKPQTYANIGGVQFKRLTRRGKRHYYRAV